MGGKGTSELGLDTDISKREKMNGPSLVTL